MAVFKRETPRAGPDGVTACPSCNKSPKDIGYGDNGVCWACHVRVRAKGIGTASPLVQIARIIGKGELCARLGIDDVTLLEFMDRDRLPGGIKEKIYELLDEVRTMHALGIKGARATPLPYREKEDRVRDWSTNNV